MRDETPTPIQALVWLIVGYGLFTMAHQIGLAIFG